MISKLHDFIGRAGVAALFIGLMFLPIFSHAGGLAMAPLAFTFGCFGVLYFATQRPFPRPPFWFWPLALLVIWAMITTLWTLQAKDKAFGNALVLLVMIPIICAAMPIFKVAAKTHVTVFRHLLMASTVMAIGLLIIDLLSGYGLNMLFDPLKEGQNIGSRHADAEMNLGHGITAQTLLLAPVLVLMWTRLRGGKIGGLVLAAGLVWAGFLCRLAIAPAAVLAMLVAMGAVMVSPRLAVKMLFVLAIALILGAPIFGFLASLATDEALLNIPLSWEHRVRMWAYSWEQIAQAPIFGHGFDAVRTYDASFTARDGYDITIVSLHPHNAGLHIWTETGVIGAALASLTLAGLYKPAQKFAAHKPRALALAGFMACLIVISSLTYGVWQYWWWGMAFIAIGALQFVPKEAGVVPGAYDL